MNTTNRSTWIKVAATLGSCFLLTSCMPESKTTLSIEGVEKIEEIEIAEQIQINPAAEKEGCTFQASLAFAAYAMKTNGVPESQVLDEVDNFKDPMPQWLYIRYQQIIRDLYRSSRNINDYAGMVYHECKVFQLYVNNS